TRYQADYYGSGNGELYDLANPNTPQLVNTTADRQRLRLRVRMNTLVQVADHVDAGITIATGTTSNPVSTTVTMGDYNNKKSIVLDKAFIRYKPVPELSLITGRMPNPFFSTDLVWDPNVNFDGAAMVLDTQVGAPLRAFLTAGAFPLYEVEDRSSDKWLYACQVGMRFKPAEFFRTKLGLAYYHYKNVEGRVNDVSYPNMTDWTAPQSYTRGNTLMDIDPTSTGFKFALAPEFHEVAVTASADIAVFDPIHVIVSGEYVKNIGFDYDKVYDRADPSHIESSIIKKTTGYLAMLCVGTETVADSGEWRLSVARKYVGNDCVLDAFTDWTFHTGGTNAKGY
ncbi:outer membrane receptor for ferric coprogen and ferric-rhodotorulic acid, partial [bacterium]|nr:outer membrane receptor for ferric coprogen and ferric-rhodotorulic acid [bacterium]